MNEAGSGVTCKKCGTFAGKIEFFCSFCDLVTEIPVEYRVAAPAGRATVINMSVHKTVIFSVSK